MYRIVSHTLHISGCWLTHIFSQSSSLCSHRATLNLESCQLKLNLDRHCGPIEADMTFKSNIFYWPQTMAILDKVGILYRSILAIYFFLIWKSVEWIFLIELQCIISIRSSSNLSLLGSIVSDTVTYSMVIGFTVLKYSDCSWPFWFKLICIV